MNCSPGRWSATTGAALSADCKACAVDSFSVDEGRDTSCDKCAEDATTETEGQTICLKCNAGLHLETAIDSSKSCRACPSGFVSIYGVSTCSICEAGTWSNVKKTICVRNFSIFFQYP